MGHGHKIHQIRRVNLFVICGFEDQIRFPVKRKFPVCFGLAWFVFCPYDFVGVFLADGLAEFELEI